MEILIYARVSHDASRQGRSVGEQIAEAEAWADREGWLVTRVVRETGSASRFARRNRERWEEVMNVIRAKQIDAVITWEASRATRDLAAYAELRDACVEHGVKWGYSGTLHDLSQRDSRFRTGLDALLAEDEAARTSERVRRSVRSNAEAGRPHGKQIYGYRRIYDETTRALVRVEPDPETAPVVREAASRILNGETCYQVAKTLNSQGIPPRRPSYREARRPLGWTAVAITQMLSMPAYAGLRQHQGSIIGDANWPPLIEPDVWHRLQAILHRPERKRANDWPAKHLLAGIAVCGVCGVGARVGKQNAGRQRFEENGTPIPRATYRTYLCAGTPGRTGFHVAMREEHLDTAVTEAVLARLERPDFLATLGERDDTTDVERAALVAEIETHRAWLEEVRHRAESEHRLDLLFDQEGRTKPKIDAAQKRLETLAATDPVVLDLARAGAVREAWERLALPEKRRVIRALVVPRVMPVPRDRRGRRGINLDRLDLVWR